MASARSALGDHFADRWASAPPWRFCLPDGDAWLAGAVAPSIDRAGREFPAIAAASAACVDEALGVASACQSALFAAIASGLRLDELLARLAADDAISPQLASGRTGWWLEPAGPVLQGSRPDEPPDELIALMLHCVEVAR